MHSVKASAMLISHTYSPCTLNDFHSAGKLHRIQPPLSFPLFLRSLICVRSQLLAGDKTDFSTESAWKGTHSTVNTAAWKTSGVQNSGSMLLLTSLHSPGSRFKKKKNPASHPEVASCFQAFHWHAILSAFSYSFLDCFVRESLLVL